MPTYKQLSELTPPLTLIEVGEYKYLVRTTEPKDGDDCYIINRNNRIAHCVLKADFGKELLKDMKGTIIATNNLSLPIQQFEEVDEAEKLAYKETPQNLSYSNEVIWRGGCQFGYNYRKSTHPLSLEQTEGFGYWLDNNNFEDKRVQNKNNHYESPQLPMKQLLNLYLQSISKEWMILVDENNKPIEVNSKWQIKKP